MPQYEATDPKTGRKWTWDGSKWIPQVSGTYQFGKEVARGMGFDPERIERYGGTSTGKQALELANQFMKGGAKWMESVAKDPFHIVDPIEGVATGLERGGKRLYGAVRSGQDVRGALAELMGGLANLSAGAERGEVLRAPVRGVAEVARGIAESPEKVRGTLQQAVVGRAEVERARVAHEAELQAANEAFDKKVAEVGRKTAADEAAHKLAIEQSKDKYAAAVAEHAQKVREASARESGATVRKRTFVQPRSGPVYQRLAGMADNVASGVAKLDRSVRAAYDARWGAWRQAMGEGVEADFTPVIEAVAEAEDNILKGSPENITVFRNILSEAEDPVLSQASVFRRPGAGIDIKEAMRNMSPATRDRVLRSLEESGIQEERGRPPIEPTSLPIDDIRGYVTELQQKMYSRSVAGDVRRALKSVMETADGIVESEAGSRGQLGVYRKLKADWSQYLSDFYDSDGPLTKLKGATNPDSRLNLLSGSEGANIVDALGRYTRIDPKLGTAAVDVTGRVRSLMKQLREMPAATKIPEAPERPTFPAPKPPRPMPERPGIGPFAPEKFRREQIQRTADNLSRITGWDVASVGYALRELFTGEVPWALGYPVGKRLLSRLLSDPRVIEYLSRERGVI